MKSVKPASRDALRGRGVGKVHKKPPGFGDGPAPWEAPGATQEPTFIERRLSRAPTTATVFRIVSDQGFCMTEENLTSAFVRLATLAESYEEKREVLGTDRFVEMVFTAAQNARVFQTDQLAHIMWSMAKLGAQPCVEVMDTIMYAMYQTIDASHLQAITTALWSMARLDYIPGEKVLLKAIETIDERLSNELSPPPAISITEAVWALAAMGHRPSDVFLKKCSTCILSMLQNQGFPPFDLAQLMWAYVRLGYTPDDELLAAACQVALDSLPHWKPDALALLAWSMGKLNHADYPPQLLSAGIQSFSIHECGWPALTRMISASATFCDHPGEDFLKKAVIVFADLADSIYSEAIESVLYSFATFSFHPGYQLLEKFSSRVLENPTVFSPLHLANILWCFALFEFCDNDLWTVVVKEFSRLMESSDVGMPPMALYRIYQVFLLKNAEQHGFNFPTENMLNECANVWNTECLRQKNLETPLHKDVGNMLSKLQRAGGFPGKLFSKFVTQDRTLCLEFYTDELNIAMDLIELKEFTRNTQMPIGSAIMRTRILQSMLNMLQSKTVVTTIEATKWDALESEESKMQYLQEILLK